jgi:hypothetical protein
MTLAYVVDRIASDPASAAPFAQEPQAVLTTSGLMLEEEVDSARCSITADTRSPQLFCSQQRTASKGAQQPAATRYLA